MARIASRSGLRSWRGLVVLLGVFVSSACGGSDSSTAATDSNAAAAEVAGVTVTAPEPTAAPDPTEVPEPTPAPEPTATPTPEPDPTATPEPEPAYDFAAVGPVVEDFVAANELNGAGLIIVDREDGVVHHEHWGEFSEDRISLIASSSKMITAGVLLRLQDDGLLDISAPVSEVTGWTGDNPEVTTAQLLSNSSGLVGLLPNPAYGPYICQYIPTGGLEECASQIFASADDDEDIVSPDSEFRYGGAQWQVAGGVAEAVSGKSWAELIDEIYVQPCGLEVTAFNNHFSTIGSGFDYPTAFNADPGVLDPTDNPNMEGGAYTTTGDYGKLLLMHLRDGMCGDTQVLSTDALATMHADRIASVYDGNAGAPDFGYGMGWWVDRESGYISDGGAYGSVPWLDLEDGYGAYLVIEADSGTGNMLADLLYDVVDDAMAGTANG